ncbi:MAG: alginate export family protein [Turneriella sp.]|nr:alginate export family protein [Turneriella sp.]
MKTIFKKVFFFAVAGAVFAGPLFAAPKAKAAPAEKAVKDDEVIPPEVSEQDKKAATTEVIDNYYVRSPSYATEPIDSTKPDYAKKLSETGIGVFKNIDWITFGLEQRTRYEFHNNDFRQTNFASKGASAGSATGQPYGNGTGNAGAVAPPDAGFTLFKTRAFLKLEFDWFRLVGEIQDSRRTETYYADTDGRDFNTVEPIQAYAEFHFKNLFGYDRPLTIRGGRFSLELLDRRLVGLNEWRNTTNTFQGGRITIGQKSNDWFLDLIGAQPIQRYLYDLDQPVGKHWFYGGVLSIQKWSHITTLQPFYLGLQQDGLANDPVTVPAGQDNSVTSPSIIRSRSYRNIHTVGLRTYGKIGKSGFDYDASYLKQFGTHALATVAGSAAETQLDAFAAWGEIGYTLNVSWKPRLAGFYAYISGDNPDTSTSNGGTNEGFDRLFGFGRPWSSNDFFRAENLNNPKIILEFEPFKDLKIDTAYSWYWTAQPHAGISGLNIGSGQAAQTVNNSLAPTSATNALASVASDKIGEEYNIRIRYPFPHLKVDVGYAYFKAGDWLTYVKRGGDSHFAYIQLSARLWE